MSAPVPFKRTEPLVGDILVSSPVRGQTWRELGMLLHWLRGHGMQLIPAHPPRLILDTTSSPQSLYYRIKPQGLAIARVWIIKLDSTADPGSEVLVTLPGSSTATLYPRLSAYGAYDSLRTSVLVEDVAKASAQADLTLTFDRVSGSQDVTVESVACWELPRALLTQGATDLGVNFETLRPGERILDDANDSVGAVAQNLTDAVSSPRRMLWEMSWPLIETDPGAAGNPTGWVDLWDLALPCLPRLVSVGDTTHTIAWDLRGVCEGAGDTFEIRITTGNNANTDTITAAGVTTEAWLGTNQTITLDCEDPTTDDGVPGGGWETVQIAFRRTAGTGKLSIRSTAGWETA